MSQLFCLLQVNKFTTPCKKAARASAGTPETCRGLAGVKRLDKTPNTKSPLARRGRPARSLNITPVKESPLKESLPSKVSSSSNRLDKRGLGKGRLASKRKAVATLTHRVQPVKFKKPRPSEEASEPDKVNDGVGTYDVTPCSVIDRLVESACSPARSPLGYSPVCSSHLPVDASLTNLCMSNLPDLFPLAPPSSISPLSLTEDLPTEIRCAGFLRETGDESVERNLSQQTIPSKVTEDLQLLSDAMLDKEHLQNLTKPIETVLGTLLSSEDILFAISAVQGCKIEPVGAVQDYVTLHTPVSADSLDGLIEEVASVKSEEEDKEEEEDYFDEIFPQGDNLPQLELKEVTVVEQDQKMHAPVDVFPAEDLNRHSTVSHDFIRMSELEANDSGQLVQQKEKFCFSLGDTCIPRPESPFTEAILDQLTTEMASDSKEDRCEIFMPKESTQTHSNCTDSLPINEDSVTDYSLGTGDGGKNTCDFEQGNTVIGSLGIPTEFNHSLKEPKLGPDRPDSEIQGSSLNVKFGDVDITLYPGKVSDFLSEGLTTIKVEEDKIVIQRHSKRGDIDSVSGGQGINLEVQNDCLDRHNVNVIMPCSFMKGNSSSTFSVGNKSVTISTPEKPFSMANESMGADTPKRSFLPNFSIVNDSTMVDPTESHSLTKSCIVNSSMAVDIPELSSPEPRAFDVGVNTVEAELNEESIPQMNKGNESILELPELHTAKYFSTQNRLMVRSDAIQLGSNVFPKPGGGSGIFWKSSKTSIFEISPFSHNKEFYTEKLQPNPGFEVETSMESLTNDLMPDLLRNLNEDLRGHMLLPATSLSPAIGHPLYRTNVSETFLPPRPVQTTPNAAVIATEGGTFDLGLNCPDVNNEESFNCVSQPDDNGNSYTDFVGQYPMQGPENGTQYKLSDQNNNTLSDEMYEEDYDEDNSMSSDECTENEHSPYSLLHHTSVKESQPSEFGFPVGSEKVINCKKESITCKPVDRNGNTIISGNSEVQGGNMLENGVLGAGPLIIPPGKKLLPLPPTIMSSWYY